MNSPLPFTLDDEYKQNVRPKLDLIEDLQASLDSSDCIDIPLPRIVVVGNQSSDTGSPRIELSYRDPEGNPIEKTIEKVEKHVLNATKAVAGEGNGIKDHLLTLRRSGPDVPDLNLVDLPGIVYTAAKGQPKDISKQVKTLIKKYITRKETIILCVFAGDADLQTSEALEIAREFDPEGDRTIGVITKVDKLENDALLRSILLQEGSHDLGIKLGLVAVRNRNKRERENSLSLSQVADKELKYFKDHAADVPPTHLGMTALVKRLCDLQVDNLNRCFPGVRHALTRKIHETDSELKRCRVPGSPKESFRMLRSDYDHLLRLLKELVKTNYDELQDKGLSKEDEESFHIHPRIEEVNQWLRLELLRAAPKVFEAECEDDIRHALKEVSGRWLPNFLPPEIFANLMQKWFRPYKGLVEEAQERIQAVVDDVVEKAAKMTMPKQLLGLINEHLGNCLDEQYEKVQNDVFQMLHKEKDVCHTQNDYYTVTYRKLQKALAKGMEMLPKEDDSEAEMMQEPSIDFQVTKQQRHGNDAGPSSRDDNQQNDGMLPARFWLKAKLRVSDRVSLTLQNRQASHNPEEMKVMEMQLSAFCYDKVVRKRLSDELMKTIRSYLLNFLENDKESKMRSAVDEISHDEVHGLLTAQNAEEKQRRETLEAKLDKYMKLLTQLDRAGGTTAVAVQSGEWSTPEQRRLKRRMKDATSPMAVKVRR